MRLFKKYKIWLKIRNQKIPQRIFNFKRSKWKILKNKKKFVQLQLFNQKKILLPTKLWERKRYFFKNMLNLKKMHKCRYNFAISNKLYSKNITTLKTFFYDYFYKIELRIDILLWKLNILKSVFEAIYYIQRGFIYLNNKPFFSSTTILKKGDIICFEKLPIKNFLKKKSTELNCSFFEIDFYTNTIVIVKDTFMINDSFLIIQNNFPFLTLKNTKGGIT